MKEGGGRRDREEGRLLTLPRSTVRGENVDRTSARGGGIEGHCTRPGCDRGGGGTGKRKCDGALITEGRDNVEERGLRRGDGTDGGTWRRARGA